MNHPGPIMTRKTDITTGIVVAVIGAVFFFEAGSIEGAGTEDMRARLLPQIISGLIVALGVLLSVAGFYKKKGFDAGAPFDAAVLKRIAPLVLIAFGYVVLFKLFGYLAATLLVSIPVFYMFGNRGWKSLLLPSVVATGIIYYVFFSLMGLYHAPPTVLNFF